MTRIARVGLALWLVSLPVVSYARVQTWGDESALWASAAFWAPQKLRPEAELGRLAHLAGRLTEAEAHYMTAIALWNRGRPAFEQAGCLVVAHNLATLAQQRGQWAQAEMWGAYPCVPR